MLILIISSVGECEPRHCVCVYYHVECCGQAVAALNVVVVVAFFVHDVHAADCGWLTDIGHRREHTHTNRHSRARTQRVSFVHIATLCVSRRESYHYYWRKHFLI